MENAFEAFQKMIPRGHVKHHVAALGISKSYIEKWRAPYKDPLYDQGERTPLDRVEIVMRTALAHQVPERDALAGMHYLCQQFSHVAIRVPVGDVATDELTADMLKAIAEIGEWSTAMAASLKDREITSSELRTILKEGYEAASAIISTIERARADVNREREG